ncbi:MAG: lanthionine synthetase LanC family protein, partial [Bacteroidota bacterium]
MKETTERAKLLQQALDIADSLCKVAKVDDNGLYWETLSLGPNLTPTYMRDDSYYSGTTGIVAFLSQLYSQTREQKYLSVAIDAAKSTLKHAQSTPQGIEGFYVGKTGVFCSLAELSLVTGDQFFVDECLSQIKTQMLDR